MQRFQRGSRQLESRLQQLFSLNVTQMNPLSLLSTHDKDIACVANSVTPSLTLVVLYHEGKKVESCQTIKISKTNKGYHGWWLRFQTAEGVSSSLLMKCSFDCLQYDVLPKNGTTLFPIPQTFYRFS